MSLLDKTNLLITPNAVKAGKLYSVIPSNGTGDCTVVRNTTATRVNSSGLIENVAANVPRVNYLTSGGTPFLLNESQSTNKLINSVFISSNGFNPSNYTFVNVFGTGSGTMLSSSKNSNVNAFNVVSPNTRVFLQQSQSFTSGVVNCFSIFIESVSTNLQVNRVIGIINISGVSVYYKNNVLISSTTLVEAAATYSVSFTPSQTASGDVRMGLGVEGAITGNMTFSMPQLETATLTSSFIPTTNVAVTRNTDVITVAPPAATVKITTTFSNGTTQVITSIPALFTLPEGLIKQVLMQNSL